MHLSSIGRTQPTVWWNNYKVTTELFSSLFIFNFTHFMHFQGQFLTLLVPSKPTFIFSDAACFTFPTSLSKRETRMQERPTGGQTVTHERQRREAGLALKKKCTCTVLRSPDFSACLSRIPNLSCQQPANRASVLLHKHMGNRAWPHKHDSQCCSRTASMPTMHPQGLPLSQLITQRSFPLLEMSLPSISRCMIS